MLTASLSAFDPGCVKTREAFVGAQQKNRTCGLGKSFMRGRHPVRIYLLPERPAKRFSRSQDPLRTSVRCRRARISRHYAGMGKRSVRAKGVINRDQSPAD